MNVLGNEGLLSENGDEPLLTCETCYILAIGELTWLFVLKESGKEIGVIFMTGTTAQLLWRATRKGSSLFEEVQAVATIL